MKTMDERKQEVAMLILDELGIDDIELSDIDYDAPLFATQDEQEIGIGLDSVDALEIIVALRREYGVEVVDEDRVHLKSFSSIASYVHQNAAV